MAARASSRPSTTPGEQEGVSASAEYAEKLGVNRTLELLEQWPEVRTMLLKSGRVSEQYGPPGQGPLTNIQ